MVVPAHLRAAALLIAVLLAGPSLVRGQNISVQQPTLQTFGVGTTVMAPDRGGAYAGGVGRGAYGRARYGFVPPWASNLGLSNSAGGVSVHPWIHDLKGIDEALQNVKAAYGPKPVLSSNAEHAYRTLHAEASARVARNEPAAQPPAPPQETPEAAPRAVPSNLAPRQNSRLRPEQAQALKIRAKHFAAQGNARMAEAYHRLADEAERR